MGKPRNNRRQISQHEIDDIARVVGMSCDKKECCLDKGKKKKKKARKSKTRTGKRVSCKPPGQESTHQVVGVVDVFEECE